MLLLLLICVVSFAHCETPTKTYYIRKDYFHGFKPGEFTIYSPTGEITHYRIESRYAVLHSLDLVSYPTKEVVGKLKAKLSFFLYEAKFTLLNTRSNDWMNGTINANFQLFDSKFTIRWNDRNLTMLSETFSLTTRIFDSKNPNIILAKFTKRFESYLLVNKFDMEIYTDEIPDGVFLFCLAVRDRNRRTNRRD